MTTENVYDFWDDESTQDRPEFSDAWKCDNDSKAEWCIQKYQEADKELKKWEAHYEECLTKARAKCEAVKTAMLAYLQSYYSACDKGGLTKKTKTQGKYQLPSGTLVYKNGGWDYTRERDDARLIAWCDDQGLDDFLKTTVTVKWAELKSETQTLENGDVIYKDTGEVVQGIKAVKKPDVFEIGKGTVCHTR